MRVDPDTCRDPDLLAAEVRRLQAVIDAGEPSLTDAEREAILYCVSCAQDYRDRLDGSEERATQMIQTAMRVAMPHVGPAPVEGQRTASVTDVGGAGPT